jgi:hypothetical protein
MPPRTTYLSKRQRRFFEKLAEGSSVATAAKEVGMSRAAVYKWRTKPKLAEEWDQAVATGIDLLEDIARQRAVDGNDGMLTLWLKCRRPEVWNRQPPPAQPPVDQVMYKITTVQEAVARVRRLGMTPLTIEGDFDEGDEQDQE